MKDIATMERRITLKDVAEKAQFSVNTVSKVLSGQTEKARISAGTAKKIQRMAQRMGYIPNQMARNLRAKNTGVIGVFVSEMTDPIYACITHAVLEHLPKYDLFPLLTVSEAGLALCRESWVRNRIEGLILCGTTEEMNEGFFGNLKRQKITAVIAGNYFCCPDQRLHHPPVCSIGMDNKAAIQMAIEHLRAQGCRQMVFVSGPPWHSDAIARQQGYEAIIRHYHKPVVVDAGDKAIFWKRGYVAAEMLVKKRTHFDAIIAYDDLVAIGANKYLSDHNIRVPADVLLIGIDNLPQAEYSSPSLTSLEQPAEVIGRKSVELLLSHLQNKSPIEHIHLLPSLIVRNSTTGCRKQSSRAGSNRAAY